MWIEPGRNRRLLGRGEFEKLKNKKVSLFDLIFAPNKERGSDINASAWVLQVV